jgi:hypothetical protein
MTRFVTWLGVILLLGFHLACAATHLKYSGTDRAGKNVSLAELLESNKLVLLNFWLAGCGPSSELLPYIQAFQDTYAAEGLQCVVVYCYHECTAEIADQYLAEHEYTMPIIEDRSGELQQLFCVNAFPHTCLLTSAGELLLNDCGYCSGAEVAMQELIHQQLLKQPLAPDQVINLREQPQYD